MAQGSSGHGVYYLDFQGGITNTGKITGATYGIWFTGASQFGTTGANGGITNTGTIVASEGIYVANIGNFNGGIDNSNTGTISANGIGIFVGGNNSDSVSLR